MKELSEQIIDRPSVQMYESDQAKYSIAVNRRRAIPEIRDGLKPVQRRILYAAYKKHMTKPEKKDKSYSLSGEVMGNFHPHGECYGSIVTMVQWLDRKSVV